MDDIKRDHRSKKIDMTQGSILFNVLLFAIPIIIGNVLQQTYTTVDTLVVSRNCTETALAAVGTSAQPVEVLLCIFLGIGAGVSIPIAQSSGAGDLDKVISISKTATSFVYLCGIPVTILGWFATPFILSLMRVPADVSGEAVLYTRIVLLGTIGNIGYNMNAGILRGLGDSIASLCFLVVSAVTNIALDIVFVAFFKLGVMGASLATMIALLLSWLVSMIYVKVKFPELEFTFLPRYYNKDDMKNILMIGLPIGLNNSLYSLGHMAMQVLVNSQGTEFMAGLAVGGRITGLSNITIVSMAASASTFAGQNYGARNYSRLREGYRKLPAFGGLITLMLGLVFVTLRYQVLRLFTDDEVVLMYAARFIVVLMLSQWSFAVFNCLCNILNGIGLVKYTTIVNLLMLWAVRIPAAYLISRFWDGRFVMVAFPISFVFGMVSMILYCNFSKSFRSIIMREDAV